MPRIAVWRRRGLRGWSVDQTGLGEVVDHALDLCPELLGVRGGGGEARNRLSDELGRVLTIAVGEDERRSKAEPVGPDALGVVEAQAGGPGLEAEVRTGSRVTTPSSLHITKLRSG